MIKRLGEHMIGSGGAEEPQEIYEVTPPLEKIISDKELKVSVKELKSIRV